MILKNNPLIDELFDDGDAPYELRRSSHLSLYASAVAEYAAIVAARRRLPREGSRADGVASITLSQGRMLMEHYAADRTLELVEVVDLRQPNRADDPF